MTAQANIIKNGSAAGFAQYCFVIRTCLEQDLHEPPGLVADFMEQNRERIFSMYATSVPAAAAVFAFAQEFEATHHAW